MARSRSVRRTTVKKSPTVSRKPKAGKVTYTAEQVRKAFPNAQAESVERITSVNQVFTGTPDEIANRIKKIAQSKGIKGEIKVERRHFSRKGAWSTYSEVDWAIVGFRPYSDAELATEGPKLVKKENDRRMREYKKELKKVQSFNKLANDVGQPLMAEPPKPELLTL